MIHETARESATASRIRACALLADSMLREAERRGLRAEVDISCDETGPGGAITVHVWDGQNLWSLDISPDTLSYGKRWFRADMGWRADGAGRRCVVCGSETDPGLLCDRCFPEVAEVWA